MRTGSEVIDPAPPVPRDGGGGGGWAWLMTARGVMEAELIRGLLESAGIVPVALDATDPSPGAWLYLSGNVNALVRVLVPKSLLDPARLVMLEAGWDVQPDQPRVVEPTSWKWWISVVIACLIVALFIWATWHGAVVG